jgi:hypothetical protein
MTPAAVNPDPVLPLERPHEPLLPSEPVYIDGHEAVAQ